LDSLCDAGVYDDDSQVDELHIIRGEPIKGGKIVVTIEVMGDE
jgi:Holliday junction resolvase RusA-like endonuclease